MAAEFKEADAALIELAQELINEHHPWLREAKIGFMYRTEAAKSDNLTVSGKARKVSAEQQMFMDFDFVIWIAEDTFAGYSPLQRRALVDHELCHCAGFPGKWQMRGHDFAEFVQIIERYGLWNDTLKRMGETINQPALPGIRVALDHAGMVRSVPGNLLERAKDDPDQVARELVDAARGISARNGGRPTASVLQRELGISLPKANQIMDIIRSAEERLEENDGAGAD